MNGIRCSVNNRFNYADNKFSIHETIQEDKIRFSTDFLLYMEGTVQVRKRRFHGKLSC